MAVTSDILQLALHPKTLVCKNLHLNLEMLYPSKGYDSYMYMYTCPRVLGSRASCSISKVSSLSKLILVAKWSVHFDIVHVASMQSVSG